MGMSTRIIGFVSLNDETYKKHSKVLIACNEAGISLLPRETAEYFGSNSPDLYLLGKKLEVHIPYNRISDIANESYEIIVSQIPKGIHKIRFVNSW